MRLLSAVGGCVLIAASAQAQTSISACGPLPDSTSKQQIKSFGELRVCMVATKIVGSEAVTPLDWAAKGAVVVLETQRPGDNRRAAISGSKMDWTIDGRPAPQDSFADRWQRAVVELLDASFEADEFRGRLADLRTQVDSLPARRAATISRIRDVERLEAELNRQIVAERSREASRRNDISRLERQRNEAEGRAQAEEMRASSIADPRARAAVEASARAHREQARRIDEQLRSLDRNDPDFERRRMDLEDKLRALNADGSLALLRMQLANYDSTRVEDIEQLITRLDAPQRLPVLDARVEKARLDLLAVLEARGKAPSP